jgi:hypothetical protein
VRRNHRMQYKSSMTSSTKSETDMRMRMSTPPRGCWAVEHGNKESVPSIYQICSRISAAVPHLKSILFSPFGGKNGCDPLCTIPFMYQSLYVPLWDFMYHLYIMKVLSIHSKQCEWALISVDRVKFELIKYCLL